MKKLLLVLIVILLTVSLIGCTGSTVEEADYTVYTVVLDNDPSAKPFSFSLSTERERDDIKYVVNLVKKLGYNNKIYTYDGELLNRSSYIQLRPLYTMKNGILIKETTKIYYDIVEGVAKFHVERIVTHSHVDVISVERVYDKYGKKESVSAKDNRVTLIYDIYYDIYGNYQYDYFGLHYSSIYFITKENLDILKSQVDSNKIYVFK